MARVIAERMGLNIPNQVDHWDRRTRNNRRRNLRPATRSQNGANRIAYKNNKSGYKGVYLRNGRYCARIQINKKSYWLGQYDTAVEAAAAYDWAARDFGEFARFNGVRCQFKNGRGKWSTNTSGITGVTWDSTWKKWVARISVNNKKIHLGRFNTKEEAIRARQLGEKKFRL